MTTKNKLIEIGIGVAVILIANWLIQKPQTPQTPAGYGFMGMEMEYQYDRRSF